MMTLTSDQIIAEAQHKMHDIEQKIQQLQEQRQLYQYIISFVLSCNSKSHKKESNSHIQKTQNAKEKPFPVYLSKEYRILLRTIYNKELSTDKITNLCNKSGIKIERSYVIKIPGRYRRLYGLTEIVSRGMYRLSDRGRLYLDENYPITKDSNDTIPTFGGN